MKKFVPDNRRTQTVPALFLVLMLLSALCLAGDLPPVDEIDPEDSLVRWRWIAKLKDEVNDGPCPAVDSWAGDRFMDPAEIGPATRTPTNFCRYEFDGEVTDEDIQVLKDEVGETFLSVTPDAVRVVPFGCDIVAENAEVLEEQFLEQLGAIELESLGTQSHPFPPITLFDTHPDSENPEDIQNPDSDHGLTLSRILRRLFCARDSVECPIPIRTKLALKARNVDFNKRNNSACDNEFGGQVGFISDLAKAIQEELAKLHVDLGTPGKLQAIFNFSVGFDSLGTLNGVPGPAGGAEGPRDAIAAVQRALEEAACNGVLSIAAAGNSGFGPDSTISTRAPLPARWNLRSAPTFEECTAMLGTTNIARVVERPLVTAISGIEADEQFLANSRLEHGVFASFADHAVVLWNNQPTEPLVGTSVAAIAGAAGAAAVWQARPEFVAGEVLEFMRTHSESLDESASLCVGGPEDCGRVNRLSLCKLRNVACSEGRCGTPLECAPFDGQAVDLDLTASCEGEGSFRNFWPDPSSGCTERSLFREAPPQYPCPHEQFWDVSHKAWINGAFVGPQPGNGVCEPCAAESETGLGLQDGALYLNLDPDLASVEVSSLTVVIVGKDAYSFENKTFKAGTTYVIRGMPLAPGDQVLVTAVISGYGSITSTVLIAE